MYNFTTTVFKILFNINICILRCYFLKHKDRISILPYELLNSFLDGLNGFSITTRYFEFAYSNITREETKRQSKLDTYILRVKIFIRKKYK